ncbi:MAG TPA: hypothetical protein DCF84_06710 [Bacteroidetes bacterium]|nr:hypothetical protein [Bacteroidota bacterium]
MEYTAFEILGVFAITFFAGVINVMAGGGSLFVLPFLIDGLGVHHLVANCTNRVAILAQCSTASYEFKRRGVEWPKPTFQWVVLSIGGAIIGAVLTLYIDKSSFMRLLGIVMILAAGLTVFPMANTFSMDKNKQYLLPICMFFIGVYGGLIQAGTGLLMLTIYQSFYSRDLVQANAVKVLLVSAYTSVVLVIFIYQGLVDWRLAGILIVGNVLGSFVGSHLAITKGSAFLRKMLVFAFIAMAIKLLFF